VSWDELRPAPCGAAVGALGGAGLAPGAPGLDVVRGFMVSLGLDVLNGGSPRPWK